LRSRLAATVRRRVGWIAPLVFLLLVGNVLWLISDAQRYGGGASGGYVRDGHYFLGNHGALTEVDQGTWEWMRLHETTVFLSFPLAIVGGLLISTRRGWQWFVGGPPASAAERRIESIRHSGRPILEAAPALRFSTVEVAAGVASLIFHPAGLIVRLPEVEGMGIARTDVLRIEEHPTVNPPDISITHIAPDIASPLIVLTAKDSEVAAAIRRTLDPA
jgi:hypothetical protein